MSKTPKPTEVPARLVARVRRRTQRKDKRSKELKQELRDRLLIARITYAQIREEIYKDIEIKSEYFGTPGRPANQK